MQTWVIEPRDPLIVRDGRMFSAEVAGARATSLDFPFPSTLAGGVRTLQGHAQQINFEPVDEAARKELAAKLNTLRDLSVCGPLLVELNECGEISEWLLPAPADALWCSLKDGIDRESATLEVLAPMQVPPGVFINLPEAKADPDGDGLAEKLCPVGTWRQTGKPFEPAPRYWKPAKFKDWLLAPQRSEKQKLAEWGHGGPPKELRTHVGIQPDSLTALDGALYQTRGLEFTEFREIARLGTKRLGLAVWTTADKLGEGLRPLGGERRLVHWRKSGSSLIQSLADCKETIIAAIKQSRACRVVLLTPAHFTGGYRPHSLLQASVKLKAVAINRAKVVSGWDFDRTKAAVSQDKQRKYPGQAKKSRRLAPAGSVYFLKFVEDAKETDIEAWCNEVWLQCMSDEPQDCRDGFGLAVLGTWSGQLEVQQ